jgi:prophage antirepressor-like protein
MKEEMDEMIIRLFDDDKVSGWVCAKDICALMGYEDVVAFKSVVWSLTRLTMAGRLESLMTNYKVPYRRGTGEQRRVYRLPSALPAYLTAQALR